MTLSMLQDLLITYGALCQHTWTHATRRYDHLTQYDSETNFICPYANGGGQSGPSYPSYVGMNYYCESGTDNQVD